MSYVIPQKLFSNLIHNAIHLKLLPNDHGLDLSRGGGPPLGGRDLPAAANANAIASW